MKTTAFIIILILAGALQWTAAQNYPIIDTGQEACYDTNSIISTPGLESPWYGQDAQYNTIKPAYQDNGDGTVTDLNTGLIWAEGYTEVKVTFNEAVAGADTFSLAGYSDWRLPTIKELYSLMNFAGETGLSASESIPYIDTAFFEFRYGLTGQGERFIDAQYVSSTEYAGVTMSGDHTVFGLNLADGRIKGYGTSNPLGGEKLFEVKYVRGTTEYGINDFVDNGDGTITDNATSLMWARNDNGNGVDWVEALAYVKQKNSENYLGYGDWRLPNAKELQSIVDYTRSPQTTSSAAIDPAFNISTITDEGGNSNYPFFWTSTTHKDGPIQNRYARAVYIAFGEALGFMEGPPGSGNYTLWDVHGAGAQRSDVKVGDPDSFPIGQGPQGDVQRIYNYVRLVRGNGIINDVGENDSHLPEEYQLGQNYPNPFNPETTITFSLPESGTAKLIIYNTTGEQVAELVNEELSAGDYQYHFNASNLTSGVYFYRLQTASFTETKKMMLLK